MAEKFLIVRIVSFPLLIEDDQTNWLLFYLHICFIFGYVQVFKISSFVFCVSECFCQRDPFSEQGFFHSFVYSYRMSKWKTKTKEDMPPLCAARRIVDRNRNLLPKPLWKRRENITKFVKKNICCWKMYNFIRKFITINRFLAIS